MLRPGCPGHSGHGVWQINDTVSHELDTPSLWNVMRFDVMYWNTVTWSPFQTPSQRSLTQVHWRHTAKHLVECNNCAMRQEVVRASHSHGGKQSWNYRSWMQRQGEYDYVTKIEFHKTFPFSVSVISDRSVIIICDREPPNQGKALVTGFEGGLGFRAGAILTRQSNLGRWNSRQCNSW